MRHIPLVEDRDEFIHRYRGSFFGLYSTKYDMIYPVQLEMMDGSRGTTENSFWNWIPIGDMIVPSPRKSLTKFNTRPMTKGHSFHSLKKEKGLLPVFDLPPEGFRYFPTEESDYPGRAVYISRYPRRQYRMGLSPRNYTMTSISSTEERIFMESIKKMDWMASPYVRLYMRRNQELFIFFNPKLFSFREALGRVKEGKDFSVPFGPQWAVGATIRHKEIALFYKTDIVGHVEDETPILSATYNFLEESLNEEMGLVNEERRESA